MICRFRHSQALERVLFVSLKEVYVPLKPVAPRATRMESTIPSRCFTEPGRALRLGPPALQDWAPLLQPRDPSPLPRDLQAGPSVQEAKAPGFSIQWSSSTSTAALELLERPSRRGAHLTPSSSCPASPYLPSPGQSSSQCNLVLCSSDFSIIPPAVSLTPHLGHGALSPLAQGSVELRPGRWLTSL